MQYCVSWAGDWPKSIKCTWLDVSDCLAVDILEYKAEMASLEDAAEGVPTKLKVIGERGRWARKILRDRIVLPRGEGGLVSKQPLCEEMSSPPSSPKASPSNDKKFHVTTVMDYLDLEANAQSTTFENSDEDAGSEELSME